MARRMTSPPDRKEKGKVEGYTHVHKWLPHQNSERSLDRVPTPDIARVKDNASLKPHSSSPVKSGL